MPYVVNKSDGTVVATVADGVLNDQTSLRLIGQNYAGYGEIESENLVHLMENFANTSPPSNPIVGQLWFDKDEGEHGTLKVLNKSTWDTVNGAVVGSTEPSGLTNESTGLLWVDTANNDELKVYKGTVTGFVTVSGGTPTEVPDSGTNTVTIGSGEVSVIRANGENIAVFSDRNITTTGTAISGFTSIKKGLTINPGSGYELIATDSAKLGGVDANQYVKVGTPTDPIQRINNNLEIDVDGTEADAALQIGEDQDLNLYIAGNHAHIKNKTTNGNLILGVKNHNPIRIDGATGDILISGKLKVEGSGEIEIPDTATDTTDITSSKVKITPKNDSSVHHYLTFVGSQTGGQSVYTDSSLKYTPLSGVLTVTATSAYYADLAEKYTTDSEYPVGTVLIVDRYGDTELTEYSNPYNNPVPVIGVVSDNPAYLMNANSEGQSIGLVGRVPVRAVGNVHKGDILKGHNSLKGVVSVNGDGPTVGVALENKEADVEGLIECYLYLNK